MTPLTPNTEKERPSFLKKIQKFFLSGLLFLFPFVLTTYAIIWLITVADSLVQPLFPEEFHLFNHPLPGYGLITIAILSTFIGFIIRSSWPNYFLNKFEIFLSKMPVVWGIYSTIKQISQALLDQDSTAFKKVALIEYPRAGIHTLCFVTSSTESRVQEKTSEKLITVFVPTTPNPTSGFLLFVPQKDIQYLDISVEEGLKLVVSMGVIKPS